MEFNVSGVNFIHFEQIDSTNNYAKRQFENVQKNSNEDFFKLHKTVYVADSQTNGHGRSGRIFHSPKDTGAYFSLVYCSKNIQNPGLITALSAVAVCNAIEKIFKVQAKIKWVNDIFVNQKKVCGILAEGVINQNSQKLEAVIIGIGINIYFSNEIPVELSKKAGGILQNNLDSLNFNDENSKNLQKNQKIELIQESVKNLIDILDNLNQKTKDCMQEYKNRSILIGKNVTVSSLIQNQNDYECTVLDINEQAKLVVKLLDGTIKILDSGEVSLHQNY